VNQKYSGREALLADCPKCRQPYLVLLKSASGKKERRPVGMQKLQASDIFRGTKEKIVYCLMRER